MDGRGAARRRSSSCSGWILATATFAKGDLAVTSDYANVRRTPGINGKPGDDVLGMFAPRAVVNVAGGPDPKDNLTWWRVGGIGSNGVELIGYVAERTPDGAPLLAPASKLPDTAIPDKTAGSIWPRRMTAATALLSCGARIRASIPSSAMMASRCVATTASTFLTPTGTLLYAARWWRSGPSGL